MRDFAFERRRQTTIVMAMERLRRNVGKLREILRAKGNARKKLLCEASAEVVAAVVDALKMVIKRKVPLSPTQLSNARRKERVLKRLANGRTTVRSKKRILVQDGSLLGFIAPLLRLAAPVLGNLLGGVLGTGGAGGAS